MSKDYKNIQNYKPLTKAKSSKLKSPAISSGIGLCVGIIIGYSYGYSRNHQSETIQPEVVVKKPANTENDTPTPTPTPTPQYDFYHILPNTEVNISEWEADNQKDTTGESEAVINKPGLYILQIGSFEQYNAADKIKAELALMGISANIQRVVINGEDIRHRVRVGPYHDLAQLTDIRNQLSAHKINYVLLTLAE